MTTAVVERDVRPVGPWRMPPGSRDAVLRRFDPGRARVIFHGDEEAIVRAWPVSGAVRVRAESASELAAAFAVDRMRFLLSLDHDLGPFHREFRDDPLIGPIIRRQPWLRPLRRAVPFEALAWAITEQLIDGARATDIQRRLIWRYGRRSGCGRFRDVPTASVLADRAPFELAALDLHPKRATAMIKAAREVASGRVDLLAADPEPGWRRLLAISNIGPWTIECLALHGQGRDDMLPAGDLAYIKLVGRMARLGRRATENEVREFFAPYAEYAGLAGTYMLRALRERPHLTGAAAAA